MEGILETLKPEITAEYLSRLYKSTFYGDNEHIIFNNGGRYQGGILCSCGHVFEKYSRQCPDCGTEKEVYYKNRSQKPAKLTIAIYYRPNVENDDCFTITRYELYYIVDDIGKKVERGVREHSTFVYNHQDGKAYIVKGKKKYDDILKFKKHSSASIVKVYYDELEEIKNCRNFYEKTGFKELLQEEWHRYGWDIDTLIDYIYYYLYKSKGLEILLKAGLERIAAEVFNNNISLGEGTKLTDFIKLPKSIIHYVKEKDFGYQDIKLLEKLNQMQPLTKETIDWLYDLKNGTYGYLAFTKIEELLKYGGYTLNELIKYAERADMYQAIPPGVTISLLSDYVNMALLANLPYEKFPDSLKKAHDLMTREFRLVQAKEAVEQFKKSVQRYKYLKYRDNEYAIIVPQSPDDLVREGNKLHHCVASYTNKVIAGETKIVFLRRLNELETPFYTIEVNGSCVVQVRGFGNRYPTSEVISFLEKWANEKDLILNF